MFGRDGLTGESDSREGSPPASRLEIGRDRPTSTLLQSPDVSGSGKFETDRGRRAIASGPDPS